MTNITNANPYSNASDKYLVLVGGFFLYSTDLNAGSTANTITITAPDGSNVDGVSIGAWGGGTQPTGYQISVLLYIPRKMICPPGGKINAGVNISTISFSLVECATLEDALRIL